MLIYNYTSANFIDFPIFLMMFKLMIMRKKIYITQLNL